MIHVTMKHLDIMCTMIEQGTEAYQLIENCKANFVLLVNQLNSYEFHVIKQQVFKFYQDKHIKVSLFIQDKIQALDGTIHLNFVGKNVIYTPKGNIPGTVKLFGPSEDNDSNSQP